MESNINEVIRALYRSYETIYDRLGLQSNSDNWTLQNWTDLETETGIIKRQLRKVEADGEAIAREATAESIILLLDLNRRIRAVPLHHFGSQWKKYLNLEALH